jgi:hypothetical protein
VNAGRHIRIQTHSPLESAGRGRYAKYRAALEAGVDPETVGEWISTVKAERAASAARGSATRTADKRSRKLTEDEITAIVHALTDIRAVIEDADATGKARVYHELGLRLNNDPGQHTVRAQVNLDPDSGGVMVCVRGANEHLRTCDPTRITGRISRDPSASRLSRSHAS